MSMNPFTVSQDTQCVCSLLLQQQWAGAVVPAGIFTPVLQPIPLPSPGADSHWLDRVLAASSWDLPGLVQLRLLQIPSWKLLQICAKFISPSRSGDTFYPELLLSTCPSFLNCSGLMSYMLVLARGVIFVETLNKIPSTYFKWESGKIDFDNR